VNYSLSLSQFIHHRTLRILNRVIDILFHSLREKNYIGKLLWPFHLKFSFLVFFQKKNKFERIRGMLKHVIHVRYNNVMYYVYVFGQRYNTILHCWIC
jgi:hypothetical protein